MSQIMGKLRQLKTNLTFILVIHCIFHAALSMMLDLPMSRRFTLHLA
jgi:hypothetical protein